MPIRARIDHLVVMATTLEEGVRWCETVFGITPGPGGQHALMGTHNRLFNISSTGFPQAYFEIIAIDPKAPAPTHRRWFDMDDPVLRERIARDGPRLIHWVAAVDDLTAAVAAFKACGIDRGAPRAASRPTPQGLLQWRLTLRTDGQRLFDGCLPTLIEWTGQHPGKTMSASGVALRALHLTHPQAATLRAACQAIGLTGIDISEGQASMAAEFVSPLGTLTLRS